MSISASSLLVELNLSVWTAAIQDRGATEKVVSDNGASRSAAKVQKNLMAGTIARKAIADYAASCRLWHNQKTLPWSDKGPRLLPSSLFFDYKQELNQREAKFNQMVRDFIRDYPTLIQEARNNLGTLFDANDYPTPEELEHKFGFRYVISPVPEAGDFRLDVGSEEIEELKQQYERNYNSRVEEAMKDTWNRLHSSLQGLTNKLDDSTTEDGKQRRYHESLISNTTELCALLTHLNITKDPELERARVALERSLYGVDVDDIRESADIRADVKRNIDDILKNFW